MSPLPTASRAWWRHPAPLIALVLHAVVFLWFFELRFQPYEWKKMDQQLPTKNPTTQQWIDRIVADHGYLGLVTWFVDNHGEIKLYYRYARVTLDGIDPTLPRNAPGQGQLRPYRDVPMEYQPGALLVLLPPAFFAYDYDTYVTAFVAWSGVLYGLSLWLALRLLAAGAPLSAAQAGRALWASFFFLMCFGSIACARFDHVVPLLCLASIALFQRAQKNGSLGWYAACGALTAAGVLVKIVPGVVLPAALLWLACVGPRPQWRGIGALLAGFFVTLVALNGIFYAWWGEAYVRSYTYHVERGIQLESLYAGVLLATDGLGHPVNLIRNFGAAHLTTAWEWILKPLSTLLFFAVSAGVAWRFFTSRAAAARTNSAVGLLWLTVLFLLAFILTNKVLSPQYLLWIGPLLVAGYGFRPECRPELLVLLFASAFSHAIFPHLYDAMCAFHPAMVLLLNLRNALLVVLFGWLLWRLPKLLAAPVPALTGG